VVDTICPNVIVSVTVYRQGKFPHIVPSDCVDMNELYAIDNACQALSTFICGMSTELPCPSPYGLANMAVPIPGSIQ
jgi:hypothetical protein